MRRKGNMQGFTLVELIMVMLVIAVVAAISAVIVRPALNAYFDVRNRAAITADTQVAMQMIAQDVRSAVPNSIRLVGSSCVEAVPTLTGGAYRLASDVANDTPAGCSAATSASPATCSAPLSTSSATTVFDVTSTLTSTPAVGDFVVVGNQSPAQIYTGSNRATITALTTPRSTDGSLRIGIASTQFPVGYEDGRFDVVSQSVQAVTFVCDGADGTLDASGNGKGVLYRKSAYGFNASLTSCPAGTALSGAAVVAKNVRSCAFVYSPNQGNTQQNGLLSLQVEVTRNSESVTLNSSVNVANVP